MGLPSSIVADPGADSTHQSPHRKEVNVMLDLLGTVGDADVSDLQGIVILVICIAILVLMIIHGYGGGE